VDADSGCSTPPCATRAYSRSAASSNHTTFQPGVRERFPFARHPFPAGTFPGAGQAVNYLEGPVPQLDTAQVDSSHGPELLGGEAQLAKYRAHLDWMERIALPPEASRDFIRDIAITGAEHTYLTDTREALRTLIRDIKAGKADHLL
jgi:hypothetical protein